MRCIGVCKSGAAEAISAAGSYQQLGSAAVHTPSLQAMPLRSAPWRAMATVTPAFTAAARSTAATSAAHACVDRLL